MVYYEDYRLKVIDNGNGRYDIHDNKFGGRAIHKNMSKEWTDDFIQSVLRKRRKRNPINPEVIKNDTESEESLQLKRQASNNLRQQLIESGNFDSDTIEKIIDTFDKTADAYIFHKKQR